MSAPVLTDRSPDNASILGTIELCRDADFDGNMATDYGPTVSARKVIELCESVLSLRAERDAALAEVERLKVTLRNLLEWYSDSEPGHNDDHNPEVKCAYCDALSALRAKEAPDA